MSTPARPFDRKFFEGFSFARFLTKTIGLFIAILGAGSAFADWSLWLAELRDAVRDEKYAIFGQFKKYYVTILATNNDFTVVVSLL